MSWQNITLTGLSHGGHTQSNIHEPVHEHAGIFDLAEYPILLAGQSYGLPLQEYPYSDSREQPCSNWIKVQFGFQCHMSPFNSLLLEDEQ